jgi:fatty acyl-CoA reductase
MEKNIAETFRNGTFLVTGSTGFLGKVLIEKILRTCSVKNLAIIVRSKKGISSKERVEDAYKQAVSIYLKNNLAIKLDNKIIRN